MATSGYHGTRRVLLLALAAVLAVAAAVNLQQRRAFRLPDDGVTWVDSKNGVRALRVAPESAAAKAGVTPGTRLKRINGVAVGEAEQVGRILAGIGVWRRAAYTVEAGGAELTKELVVESASRTRPLDYFQFALGFVYLGIGLTVVLRHQARSMAGRFYAFCLSSFALYAFSYTGALDAFDRLIYWADVWATLLAPALFLSFCVVFPGEGVPRWRRAAAKAAFAPVAILLAMHHMAAAGVLRADLPLVELRFLLDRAEYLLLGLYFLAGVFFLLLFGRRAEPPAVRQQRRWMAQGALWGVAPFAAFYLIPFVAGQAPGPQRSLAVLSLALIPLGFAYAITRHRLMDVDLMVRRGAAYTLAAAGLLAVFYGALFLLHGWLFPRGEVAPAVWALSVVLSALAFHPLRRAIQGAIERRHYRERYDYRRTLVDFASTLSSETDLDRMLDLVTARLVSALGLRRMAVLTRQGEAGGFRITRAAGFDAGALPGALDLSFLGAGGGKDGPAPAKPYLFFDEPDWHIELSEPARRTLRLLDLNCFVPCRSRGRTIAYLGLGRTEADEFLNSDDLGLVQAISGYFAIALENAQLYRSIEQKAREYERLKDYNENIVESLSVGMLAAGLDDRVESWNTQLELMFGIPRQQAAGRRLRELLPEKLAEEFERVRGETGVHNIYKFRLRAEDFPAEVQPSNGDGPRGRWSERIVDVAITPLVAKNFQPIGRLLIFDDVTERVELEERLVQADKLSSIGLLAAGVAHEVNTPLAVISSYAQMLAKSQADPGKQAKILEKITSQTFRASEIVNSLLNFSRTSTNEMGPLDLNRLIEETLALIEPQLEKAGVEAAAELEPEAASIRGNANKLQQVLLNLFLNARDAMPEGGRLTVRTQAVETGGEPAARITVQDTGPGVAPENLQRIFDPFFTTKGYQRGTGLGLAVTYGIVQEHSGTISVESAPGQGATFHVDLPLARKTVHA